VGWVADIGFGWDNRNCAFVRDGQPDRFSATGLVRNDGGRRLLPSDKGFKRLDIMGLCTGDLEAQRPPGLVDSDVNLAAATAA
jgi:hypothetical protein